MGWGGWEKMGKTMGKPWENHGKDGGMEGNTKPKWDENHGKTMGKHQVNPEKTGENSLISLMCR